MNILFLDDSQRRIQLFRSIMPSATIVETVSECLRELRNDDWDAVFLDHDLGGETFVDSDRKDCGMEVARQMAKNPPDKMPRVFVHSLNRKASTKMVVELALAGYDVKAIPFHDVMDNLDEML